MSDYISRQLEQLKNVVVLINILIVWDDLLEASVYFQSRYEPSLFPAGVARLTPTKCTASNFGTGKVMATGSSSEFGAYMTALMLCDRINEIKPHKHARVGSFKVVNRVAAICHVGLGVDLDMEKLADYFRWSGIYERTSFPGMKIAMIDLCVTFVVFGRNIKVNIAGIPNCSCLTAIARRISVFYQFAIMPIPPLLLHPPIEDEQEEAMQIDE